MSIKPILISLFIMIELGMFNFCMLSAQEINSAQSVTRTFYISPDGNDNWSGSAPTPNLDRNDGPFATLKCARDTIRKLRQNDSDDAYVIIVREGIYQLSETFNLEVEDSGSEFKPLVIRAFDNEKPTLVGTKHINNFKPYKDNIYQANLLELPYDLSSLRQIFANGKRQRLSRHPNFDPQNPIGGGFLYVESPVVEGSKHQFRYSIGDIPAWPDKQHVEILIHPGNNWTNNILPVLGIERNTRTITLSQKASHEIKPGNRYFFQNLLEELDSPGEWFFDQQKKVLYYWPANIELLNNITIPILKSILKINSSSTYINFEGFRLDGCEGSSIILNGAKNILVARNTISNAGGNGIEIHGGAENAAIGNDIFEVGGTGIIVSGGDSKALEPANNRAENNYIHNTGVFSKGGASGILCKGVGNTISHNLIHSIPRIGIWFDGNDHLIEFNHIHHVNQETQDSGMIYCSQIDWTKRGNIVQFNYLYNSGGYGRRNADESWQAPFDTFGIYLDDWSSGTIVYGNIIANTESGGIFIHSGRDNKIQNNIIIEGGRLGQMVYSAWLPSNPVSEYWLPKMFAKIQEMGYTKYPELSSIKDEKTGSTMSGNSFVRNIVYYTDKNLNAILYGIHYGIDLSTTTSDYNTIYHAGLPLLVPYMQTGTILQWTKWKDSGFDKNSIIADPLLSISEAGKFQLSQDSPALSLGFKPIPFDKIGPYNDVHRASWPIASPNKPRLFRQILNKVKTE